MDGHTNAHTKMDEILVPPLPTATCKGCHISKQKCKYNYEKLMNPEGKIDEMTNTRVTRFPEITEIYRNHL